jgi:hypothetical protein
VKGPVAYAGGALELEAPFFSFEAAQTVSESIILRWAELTSEIARTDMTALVVTKLLERPTSERDVSVAQSIYRGESDLQCVWTGERLQRGSLAVDHVIPFSLWFNNDLWNLLPTSRRVNSVKADRLVSRQSLLDSRDRIIHCWELVRAQHEDRFETELRRSLIRAEAPAGGNWEIAAFAGLVENVETIAIQRGIYRWSA